MDTDDASGDALLAARGGLTPRGLPAVARGVLWRRPVGVPVDESAAVDSHPFGELLLAARVLGSGSGSPE